MLQKTDSPLSIKTKILTLLGIAFFAIHTIVYILKYRLNFPHGDDFNTLRFSYEFSKFNEFPIDEFFRTAGANHLTFSLKLITLPNLLLNSFDLVNLYYFQWIIMSLTLFFLYLAIKNTNKQLIWVLIPISASVYCPIFMTGYFIFSTIAWLFPSLCIAIVVYLFSRKKIYWKTFSAGISLAIFSTFFNLIGAVIWVSGLFFLRRNTKRELKNIKFIFPWVAGIVISGFVILSFTETSAETNFNNIFSIDALAFFTAYLSTSYRFGNDNIVLSQIVGIATIIISGYLFYYFLKLKNHTYSIAYPWLFLILLSFIAGLVITTGRVGLSDEHLGTQSFYKTLSFYSQIGITVLISLIIYNLTRNKLKTNSYKLKIAFLLAVIIIQMIFLIPSYYASWEKAEHYYQQKLDVINCYTLSHGHDCLNPTAQGLNPPFERKILHILNYWLENKFSIFGEENFNQQNQIDMSEFELFLESSPSNVTTIGKFEKINEMNIKNEKIDFDQQFVKLEGWILDDDINPIQSIYLLIDDKPFLKHDDFYQMDYVNGNENTFYKTSSKGWIITFLTGYLDYGCSTISILGKSDNSLLMIDDEIIICKNQNYIDYLDD